MIVRLLPAGKIQRFRNPPPNSETRLNGQSWIDWTRGDGQRDGEPAARQGPLRYGIQPHALESRVAGQKRYKRSCIARARWCAGQLDYIHCSIRQSAVRWRERSTQATVR